MTQYNVQFQDGNGSLAGLRNQLINGNMDIGQRNVSDVPDFTADRWRGQGVNVRYYVDSQGQFYRSIGPLEPSKNIVQGIELNHTGQRGQFEEGTTWTFSMYTDSTAPGASVSFRDSTNTSATPLLEQFLTLTQTGETEGSLNRWSGTVTLSSGSIASSTCLIMSIAVAQNEKFTGCQLEPGPVATPFEQRPVGLELSLCQRYYQTIPIIYSNRIISADQPGNMANSFARTVTMRSSPTETGDTSRLTNPSLAGNESEWKIISTDPNIPTSVTASAAVNITADAEL